MPALEPLPYSRGSEKRGLSWPAGPPRRSGPAGTGVSSSRIQLRHYGSPRFALVSDKQLHYSHGAVRSGRLRLVLQSRVSVRFSITNKVMNIIAKTLVLSALSLGAGHTSAGVFAIDDFSGTYQGEQLELYRDDSSDPLTVTKSSTVTDSTVLGGQRLLSATLKVMNLYSYGFFWVEAGTITYDDLEVRVSSGCYGSVSVSYDGGSGLNFNVVDPSQGEFALLGLIHNHGSAQFTILVETTGGGSSVWQGSHSLSTARYDWHVPFTWFTGTADWTDIDRITLTAESLVSGGEMRIDGFDVTIVPEPRDYALTASLGLLVLVCQRRLRGFRMRIRHGTITHTHKVDVSAQNRGRTCRCSREPLTCPCLSGCHTCSIGIV